MFRDRPVSFVFALCGLLALPVGLLLGPAAAALVGGSLTGRTFYIPSESMRPTLEIGDRISPRIAAPVDFRRGMVVVFMLGSEARVSRIVGLPGDAVQMRGGQVVLNGVAVTQRPDGVGPPGFGGEPTQRFLERLPGESSPHRILDNGAYPQDDTDLVSVPQGSLFLLGDNRDNTADSRFPRTMMGAGFVPYESVRGAVPFITWSTGRWRIGRAIDDLGADKIFSWL